MSQARRVGLKRWATLTGEARATEPIITTPCRAAEAGGVERASDLWVAHLGANHFQTERIKGRRPIGADIVRVLVGWVESSELLGAGIGQSA